MPEPRATLLLVDDVEANLVALEALLGDLDCELVRARSGDEALRQLLRREFALMLLDVQMPEMDGHEVARYAREHPSTAEVPIIFVTAMNETQEGRLRGYGAGAVDLLFKPIDPVVLRSKVRVFRDLYVGKRRLTETLGALERANEALRHFTAAASHDLRAPLRAIRGFLTALEEDAGDALGEEPRGFLDRSRRAAERMTALLDSLLAYSRLGRPVEAGAVDCRAILARVEVDLADRLAGATLVVGDLPEVPGDADRLYQLFANLVGNALKFRRPGEPPRVTVSAERGARLWTFCVADDGIGFDPKHANEVFEGFKRLHGETKYEGSGLGLTICREVVRQHQGTIWVESAEGQGARFYFTLPA